MITEQVAVQLVGQVGDLINKFVGVHAQLTTIAKGIEDKFTQTSRSIDREMKNASNSVSDSMRRIERAASGPKNSLMGIADSVVQVRGAIVASGLAVLFNEIAGAIKQAADRAQALNDTAQLLELTGSQLQGLQASAVSAGFPLAKLDSALFKFNSTLQNARDGSEEAQRFLAAFGVTVDDLKNKNFTMADALLRVSERVREYGITSETTAAMAKMFGKDNQAIVQIMYALGGSFTAAEEAARRFGALTEQERATLARFSRESAELNLRWQNIKDTVFSKLVPALEYLGTVLLQVYEAWRILLDVLLAFAAAAAVVVNVTLKLLSLDFEGAKAAWRSYAETIGNVSRDVRERIKEISENQEKMRNLATTGSPQQQQPSSGGGPRRGKGPSSFDIPAASKAVDDVALEKMRIELDAAKAGSEARVAIADRMLAYVKQKYGEESREFFAALRARQAAEREYADTRQRLADDMAQAIQAIDAQTRSDVDRNAEEIGRRGMKGLNDDLQRRREYAQNLKKINKEIFQDSVRTFEGMLQPITQAISQSIQGVVMGTQTAQQALAKLGQSILLELIDSGVHALAHHIATQLAMTQATAASTATRAALEEGAAKKSVLSTAWAGIKIIATKAAEVMASVYAAIAGIPYIGPFLAPAMAVAAGATVLGYVGRIASARGGFDVPSGVNPITQLHEKEMVLPAKQADVIRDLANGGRRRRSGGDTFHLHAMDARSFEQFLRRHGATLGRAVREFGVKNFVTAPGG